MLNHREIDAIYGEKQNNQPTNADSILFNRLCTRTNGGNEGSGEGIIRKSEQDAGFADSRIADQQ